MRTTLAATFRTSLASIERAATDLSKWQGQVSSGNRVTKPSDDPTAAASANGERAEIATIDRYVRAGDSAQSRLTLADTVLSDIIRNLTAAKSTAASADTSSATPSQREAAADQLEAIAQGMAASLNSTFRGTYLFSGGDVKTQAYSIGPGGTVSGYQGGTTAVTIDVDRSTSVRATLAASDFMQGTDSQDVFSALTDLATAVRAGDSAGIVTGQAALTRAFNRSVATQSQVGTSLSALGQVGARLGVSRQDHTARLSKDEDANMVVAISEMNRADTAYRAALSVSAKLGQFSLLDYLK